MAITFLQTKKRQRYMVLILALIIFAILIIIWQDFLKTPEVLPSSQTTSLIRQKVNINFEILKDPQLTELQAFEQILPFEEEIGRENPFIPY